MSDLVEKQSATEIKITKSVVQIQPLKQLMQQRASLLSQLDALTARVADLDGVIKQAGALGVVEALSVVVAPVAPVVVEGQK